MPRVQRSAPVDGGSVASGTATSPLRGSPPRVKYRLTPDGVSVPMPIKPAKRKQPPPPSPADHTACRREIERLLRELAEERTVRESLEKELQTSAPLREGAAAMQVAVATAKEHEQQALAEAEAARKDRERFLDAAERRISELTSALEASRQQRGELEADAASAILVMMRLEARARAVHDRVLDAPSEASPTAASQATLRAFAAACSDGSAGQRSSFTSSSLQSQTTLPEAAEDADRAVAKALAELRRLCEEQLETQSAVLRDRPTHAELSGKVSDQGAETQQLKERQAELERELRLAKDRAVDTEHMLSAVREDRLVLEQQLRAQQTEIELLKDTIDALRAAPPPQHTALQTRRVAAERRVGAAAPVKKQPRRDPWRPIGGGWLQPLCEEVLRDSMPPKDAAAVIAANSKSAAFM